MPHEFHELELGVAGAETGVAVRVEDEEEGQPGLTPRVEQPRDIGLEIAIAAARPPPAHLERVLNVDQKECCVVVHANTIGPSAVTTADGERTFRARSPAGFGYRQPTPPHPPPPNPYHSPSRRNPHHVKPPT